MIGAIVAGALSEPTAPVTNSYESIMTYTVGSGGQSSIDFTTIPSTYKHLQIRILARDNRGLGYSYFGMRFNNDSGSNYNNHFLAGGGSGSASAGAQGAGNAMYFDGLAGNTNTTGVFAGAVIDILDYNSTDKNKTVRMTIGYDNNGSGAIYFYSGLWFATPAAITSIFIGDQTVGSGNFLEGSSFALYGIKG